jgi:hypothetical protein
MFHRDLALAGLPARSHWAMIWLAIACKSSDFVDRLMERCDDGLGGTEPVRRRQNTPFAEPFRQLSAVDRHST